MALQQQGLHVRSVIDDFTVEVLASNDPAEIGPCDVVFLCQVV